MASQMLNLAGIPSTHLPLALKAFDRDSQAGFYGKRGKADIERELPDKDFWSDVDQIFADLKSPLRVSMRKDEMRRVLLGE